MMLLISYQNSIRFAFISSILSILSKPYLCYLDLGGSVGYRFIYDTGILRFSEFFLENHTLILCPNMSWIWISDTSTSEKMYSQSDIGLYNLNLYYRAVPYSSCRNWLTSPLLLLQDWLMGFCSPSLTPLMIR